MNINIKRLHVWTIIICDLTYYDEVHADVPISSILYLTCVSCWFTQNNENLWYIYVFRVWWVYIFIYYIYILYSLYTGLHVWVECIPCFLTVSASGQTYKQIDKKGRALSHRHQGAVSIRKTVLSGMAIPMLKIRRPNGRLIFNMEITIRR